MTKKVAIFFHGQARHLIPNYQIIKEKILDVYNPDVYCHVWWDETLKKDGFSNHRNVHYTFTEDTIDLIKKLYNPKVLRVEPQFHKDDIFEKYPTLKGYKCNGYMNDTLSQFLSLKMVSEIIDWDNYDFFMKWRYDCRPVNFPNLNELDSTKMYACSDREGTFMNDDNSFVDPCFIVPKEGKKLFDIFDDLVENGKVEGCVNLGGTAPETQYSKKLVEIGLNKNLIKLPYTVFSAGWAIN